MEIKVWLLLGIILSVASCLHGESINDEDDLIDGTGKGESINDEDDLIDGTDKGESINDEDDLIDGTGQDDDLESDSKKKKVITDRIFEINSHGAPKCLEDGDIRGEKCNKGQADKRNAMRNRNRLWHSRVLPYVLHWSLSARAKKAIKAAIADYHRYTCIRLVKHNPASKRHYIRFFQGRGCYSSLGKTRRSYQSISIGKGCGIKGIVIHEIMHALGFWHEQARYDRDKFVRIEWSNIKPKLKSQFKKKSRRESTTLGLPYDYDGIMHYGPNAFAINKKKPTIVKLIQSNISIGQRNEFSYTDLAQLNLLYSCESSCSATWSEWSVWSHCINFRGRHREQRQRFCMDDDLNKCIGAHNRRVQKNLRNCNSDISGMRRSVTCEGSSQKIECPNGYRLFIHRANYGRTKDYVCTGKDRPVNTISCRSNSARTLAAVRNTLKCQGRQKCVLLANSKSYGNPCRGTFKYLEVKYSCNRSRG